MKPEELVVKRVSNYLLTEYPNIIFRFDLFADLKMSIQAAKRLHSLHGKHAKSYPDLFIASARGKYGGLYIELKASSVLENTKHNQQQAEFHGVLRYNGYKVAFGLGYENSVKIIDDYLSLKRNKLVK